MAEEVNQEAVNGNQNGQNNQQKKKNRGCLIAIIIVSIFGVIMILGILAAVAIPGYMAYVHNSKTSEVRSNLKAICDGALSYYQSEHCEDEACARYVDGVYPVSKVSAKLGQDVNESSIGMKYMPTSEDLGGVWKELRFMMNIPSYYTYYYISDGKTFKAKACASLDSVCDSVFVVTGDEYGAVSPIIDASGIEDCEPFKGL